MNDKDVEFLVEKDLSAYLTPQNLTRVSFEFEPKERVVNLRISTGLLNQVKQAAKKRKIPYQKYIRQVLELSIER